MNSYFYSHNYHYHVVNTALPFEFLSSETFWVASASIVTATALIYTIRKNRIDKKQSVVNIKHALYFELVTNIEMLFSREVERRPLLDVNLIIRKDFIKNVNNQKLLSKFQKLYSELDYYQTFVKKVYLNQAIPNHGIKTTEKQLSTMNIFLEFFGLTRIVPLTKEHIDDARDRAIAEKNNHFKQWKNKLNQLIEQLFK